MSPGGSPLSSLATSSEDERKNAGQMGPVLYQMVRDGRSFSGNERHCCFLNVGNGKFVDVSSVSGFDFPDDGRAVSRCDWDLDGDIDLWIANRSGPQVRFLRNDLKSPHHFLTIRLEGKECNRDAIGARVELTLEEPRQTLIQTLQAGEGFLAQSSKWIHFGLGATTKIENVVVRWPGGKAETFDGLQVDRRYDLVENSGEANEWIPHARARLPEPTEETPDSLAAKSPSNSTTQPARVVAPYPIPLPRLDFETFDDQPKWLDQIAVGQPMLINLWATWCGPCLLELSEFAKHQTQLREAGLSVVALSVDRLDTKNGTDTHTKEPTSTDATQLLKRLGFEETTGWATAPLIEKLQLVQQHLFDLHQPMSVPTSLLIDASGNLVVMYRGNVSIEQLLADVAKLPDLTSSTTALPFPGRWHTRREPLGPIDIAWRLVDHGFLDESIEYLARNKKQLVNSPHAAGLFVQIGTSLLRRGETASALNYFREALQYNEKSFQAQNNLAWVLSTHPNAAIRDGKEAIRHIAAAVKERPENAFSLLDTLAAAYAEDGQFEKAAATAQQAVNFANAENQHGFAKRIEGRLKLYKAGKPYRDQ